MEGGCVLTDQSLIVVLLVLTWANIGRIDKLPEKMLNQKRAIIVNNFFVVVPCSPLSAQKTYVLFSCEESLGIECAISEARALNYVLLHNFINELMNCCQSTTLYSFCNQPVIEPIMVSFPLWIINMNDNFIYISLVFLKNHYLFSIIKDCLEVIAL